MSRLLSKKGGWALLTRPSILLLIFITLLGVLGSRLIAENPSDIVGAPFARPIWWGGNLSTSKSVSLSSIDGATASDFDGFAPQNISFDDAGTYFVWDESPPAIFALEGEVTSANRSTISVTLKTPTSEFLLAELSGQDKYWLNLDARDMIFKRNLDLPLIGRGTDILFADKGQYGIRVSGSDGFKLKLTLKGQKQGLLGTDQRGRDVFSLLLHGIGTSLTVGICATMAATLLGLGFGLTAGYVGGLVDAVIMRVVDILLAIPTLPILMVLANVWGKGLLSLVLTLSIFSWMGTARSVRALTLSARESPWVEGLKALGAKRSYILWRHLVPEAAPVVLANIALGVPGAVLAEAGLAFLGLSDPRLVSWGRMLHEAHSFGAFTEGAWWLILPPGIGIVALCLIFMDIGRFLEEKIDPRLKGNA